MATQKAVVITAPGKAELVSDRSIPTLRDDYILVKTVTVALNPTDWKHVSFLAPPGVLVGCDYAGIVEEVGKGVKRDFKKGDRVFGFVHGSNAVQPEDGAFAQYIVARGDLQFKIPDGISFVEAATFGLGAITVGQALYQSLNLALPDSPITEPVPILIYGGSTATGTLAIQFAKLSGYTVITTCSPRNFDLVKKLGADHVYDYNDPTSAATIREQTGDNLKLAFDTISLQGSAKYCDQALSTKGGSYTALNLVAIERENVTSKTTLAYTAFGQPFRMGPHAIPALPQHREFAEKFRPLVEKLLAEGKVKVHQPKVGSGGLQGVIEGIQLLEEGKVSGEKLVYNVEETP